MTATLTDADVRLRELVEQATRGIDVVLVQDNKPIARIVPVTEPQRSDSPKKLDVPSYHLGFKGPMPSSSEIADEMLDR